MGMSAASQQTGKGDARSMHEGRYSAIRKQMMADPVGSAVHLVAF
jgi:hypothetical protein